MPIYVLKCEACGRSDEVFKPVKEAPLEQPCPCGQTAYRDFRSEMAGGIPDWKPTYCDALGVLHPEERIPGEHYDSDGRIYVGSKEHHRKLCKKLNYVQR